MIQNSAIFKRLSSQEDFVSVCVCVCVLKLINLILLIKNNDDVTVEEKHKDAIFNVTYRKVYQQPSANQNGLVYSKIKIKQIKFATIEKLVDSFTNENGELDSNTTNTFLATYRTFTTTKNFLEILFQKYSRIFPASLDMTEEIRVSYLK